MELLGQLVHVVEVMKCRPTIEWKHATVPKYTWGVSIFFPRTELDKLFYLSSGRASSHLCRKKILIEEIQVMLWRWPATVMI